MQGELFLLDPGQLRPHEDVDPGRVASLAEEMRAAGVFYPPVLVDLATNVILDGHHRWRASALLGLKRLPCWCVDYKNDVVVRVMSRRPEIAVSKDAVIATALAGRVFPIKTTRHMYDLPEFLEPIPLEQLASA